MLSLMTLLRPLSFLVLSAGCASNTLLAPQQQADLGARLRDKRVFLAVSMYAGPFFREADKRLLSPAPFAELRLIESPGGEPIVPGEEEQVWPAGTEVRVRKVEFPTSLAMTQRPILTPRHAPWVLLEIAGVAPPPPPRTAPTWIVVLRDGIDTPEAFWTEWKKHFTDAPPALDEATRPLVERKAAAVGMSANALTMSWGWPTKRVLFPPDRGVRREEWLWLGGPRRALLEDGRVIQVWPTEGVTTALAR